MRNVSLFFLFVFITEFSFTQAITFDREFNFKIHNSVQTPDGDYIISGYDIDRLVVARLNNAGYIKWIKNFTDTKNQDIAASLILVTGGFFISTNFFESYQVSNDSVFNKTYARLLKFDLDGNLLIDKRYDESTFDERGYQVIEADSGKYFFLTDHFLYKIDASGELLESKSCNIAHSIYLRNPITRISENQYLLITNTELISVNRECDTLWTYPLPGGFFNYPVFCKSTDANILMFLQKKLYKLNGSTGEKLFEKTLTDLNRMVTKNVIRKDNHIYLLWTPNVTKYSSYITILESDTIISSEIFLPRIAEEVSFCADGFTIIGYQSEGYRLLKTDEYFYYKTVILNQPTLSYYDYNWYTNTLSNQFFGLQKYNLTWESNNVDYINLAYSIDAGKNWVSIATNLSCDSSTFPPIGWDSLRYPRYEWTAPGIFSDEFYLRITDSNDPTIYDRTDPIGSIFIYQDYDTIAANNITMWTNNFGTGSHIPKTDASGFFWPNNIFPNISAVFMDGLVWGGKVNGEIRVNGNTYRWGLQPGKILENGIADDPLSTQSKIFKIRNDWQSLPEGNLKDRLEYDYNNWPVEAGAPWDDVNEDGVYTPGFDKPKCFGDETLFYVANDLDTARSLYTYGSNPIGLEFQTTIFGFNREDLKDVVFKKYKVINKSNTDITDMYFTYWADVDMGWAQDDLEAFDSTYNMAYVYNFDNNDDYNYGTPPPAIAHMIVQGPIIPSIQTDSARFDDGWRTGYKNLGMTSSGLIVKSGVIYPNDPDLGVYAGTIHFYNLMQGLNNDGSYIIDPLTNETTIWPLTGDPVTGTGWYLVYPGMNYGFDQRYHVPTGPFNLAIDDTQEIVIAIPIARGTDNLNSITKLRELAAHVQEFYNTEFVDILNTKQTVAPNGYALFQNYPNPFNPKTTIEYEVPEKSFVTIKIYDILGREVQTLVNNQEQVRFKYKLVFDASSLASGVYFYRLQAGGFTETKKMMVLK